MREAFSSASMKSLHAFPLAGQQVVFCAGEDRLHLLNASAWEALRETERGADEAQIAEAWVRQYRLPAGEARAIAAETMRALRAAGLLDTTRVPAADPSAPRSSPAQARCDDGAPPAQHLRVGLHPFSLRFGSDEEQRRFGYLARTLSAEPAPGPAFELLRRGGRYLLNRDGLQLLDTADADAAALGLAYCIAALAQRDAAQLLVLHAGAVARGGRCLAISALGGAGKSTLVCYLAHHGYEYVADDMLPIGESDLQAEPVPVCMSLKPGSWPLVAPFRPDLLELPVLRGSGKTLRLLPPPNGAQRRLPVAALVLPEYRPGSPAALAPAGAAEALQSVIEAQAYLARPLRPERVARLVRWIEELPAYRLRYDNLADAARLLQPLLS